MASMEFFTPKHEVEALFEAKGSRFLAFLVPIVQFNDRLAALKIEHRKASHHVTASRRMGDGPEPEDQASDDGEPAGTSGMPTLRVLMGAKIVDAGVITVRYFGGTKLGTGGLARAYSCAASMAVEHALLVPWHRIVEHQIKAGFAEASALEEKISALDLIVLDRVYTEHGVELKVKGPERDVAALKHEQQSY